MFGDETTISEIPDRCALRFRAERRRGFKKSAAALPRGEIVEEARPLREGSRGGGGLHNLSSRGAAKSPSGDMAADCFVRRPGANGGMNAAVFSRARNGARTR